MRSCDACNTEKSSIPYVVHEATATRLERIKVQGDSEFLRTAGGKDPVKVLAVMDELMGAVAALNKNLYEATIEKIKAV